MLGIPYMVALSQQIRLLHQSEYFGFHGLPIYWGCALSVSKGLLANLWLMIQVPLHLPIMPSLPTDHDFDMCIVTDDGIVYPIVYACYSMTGPLSISLITWYQAHDIHATWHSLLAICATSQGLRLQGSWPRDHHHRLSLTKGYPLG